MVHSQETQRSLLNRRVRIVLLKDLISQSKPWTKFKSQTLAPRRGSWHAVALGDGEQPDNAEDLWEAANSGAISSLKGLNFSVLALGDTSYDLFCESGKEWDAWFENGC